MKLMDDLNNIGFRGVAYYLIKSYIENRKYTVNIYGTFGDYK